MLTALKLVFLGAFAGVTVMTSGTAFLKPTPSHEMARVSKEDVQNSLLEEIEGSLGNSIGSKRVLDMKSMLEPMFTALPKNEHGHLDHVTVRYALHRVFVQRHGWVIKGLDHAGAGWNASSAAGILKDHVPAFIQNLFEQRLGTVGLGLKELAVFAATIEHLVHNEAAGRLSAAISLHGLAPTAFMSEHQAEQILETYMMAYVLGQDLGNLTALSSNALKKAMPEIFLAWNETKQFIREVQREQTKDNEEDYVTFASLVRIAEAVGERFGKFQDAECKGLKAALVKMEDRGTGRVRLSDFYKNAAEGVDSSWQFQESIGYLRQLGTLDESNSNEPRVMLANYLTSQANCIASSDYYSVCCIDECEDLFSHLEKNLAAPEAEPSQVTELISNLASSSVTVPRQLSATLLTRLDDMAANHGGYVQLHSRLFAQWMHHAYPRECPYPHVSGTTFQETAETWSDGNGGDSVATQEELEQFTTVSNSSASDGVDSVENVHDLMMWSHEEELLVVRPTSAPATTGVAAYISQVRNLLLFIALAAVIFGIAQSIKLSGQDSEVPQKLLV